jgi:hypothetical protein
LKIPADTRAKKKAKSKASLAKNREWGTQRRLRIYRPGHPSSVTIPATPGTEFIDEFGGEIDCNVAGIFFSFPISILSVEIAYTRSINTGIVLASFYINGMKWNSYAELPYCTPATSPPDFNPTVFNALAVYPVSSNYYVENFGACVRINQAGQPWSCTPGVALGRAQSSNLLPAFCTHNP